MYDKLKPCPLCGHEAEIQDVSFYTDGINMKIVCVGCGLTLEHKQEFVNHNIIDPATGMVMYCFNVALNEIAIDLWNRRA